MKKFLGIVCFIYSLIIVLIKLQGNLNNFLAPSMQKYILVSIPILIIMGLVLVFNNNIHYDFKFTDLILLLPLIMLVFAKDGRLTTSIASNKISNTKTSDVINEEKSDDKQYDFTNIDFDVKDESYITLEEYITYHYNPEKLVGKTIRVRGFVIKETNGIPKNYFMIGKYEVSCCAADAVFGGFLSKYDLNKINSNEWYEVTGVLKLTKNIYNEDSLYIDVKEIKKIDEEDIYVYPCHNYGDGNCSVMDNYELVY